MPQGEQSVAVELKKGQCCLLVVPTLTEDGRTRLTFTPQVKHAARDLMPCAPKSDRSGWTCEDQEAIESYAGLSWEVSLAPGQYVLVVAATTGRIPSGTPASSVPTSRRPCSGC